MIRFLGVMLVCLQAIAAAAQFDKNYRPAPVLDTIPASWQAALRNKLESDKAGVAEPSSQVSSFLKSLYDKRYEYLVKSINDDLFIDDDEITPYLQSVLDKIYTANPQLRRETSVYAIRSEVPNAMSFGDGTLGFTLGLLARMQSEAQVAFVLCHEMAHYHAAHSPKDLQQLAQLNYDRELKKKIDAARKNPYGQYSKLKEIFQGMGFSMTRHSRAHEFEADALGFEYFARTSYARQAPAEVMVILDSANKPLHPEPINFASFFHQPAYPFKSHWTAYQKSSTWHATRTEEDSMKTHPDCARRRAALQQLGAAGEAAEPADAALAYLRQKSEFEIVASHLHFKQYGKALFQALLLAQRYPDNTYLQAVIARSMYQLYAYQRNHELGKVLELPDPRFPENYDRFLDFIHKLRLMELSSLAYHYATSRPEASFGDEEFLYALWLCSTLEISKVAPDKVKEEYRALFPSGRYLGKMR